MTLVLSEGEVKEILDMKSTMDVVKEALESYALGKAQLPPKSYLFFKKGDLRIMPSYLENLDCAGTKIVNVHPKNPETNLPTVMATIILSDPKTGYPLAIMGGSYITSMRTGAIGGIAARYLAKEDSKVIGLVGAGAQAETQLLALSEVFKIEKVEVVDRNYEKAGEFAEKMKRLCSIVPVDNIKQAVDADIVCTTTPVREPIIRDEWIRDGTHINAIGADAPGKGELDPELLRRSKIVIDNFEQASHSGEINVPLSKGIIKKDDIYGEIGEIIVGDKSGRDSDREVTIFDSTGLAIQDISTAKFVYDKAKLLDGKKIKILD